MGGDERRRAYAVMGLPPGTPARALKQRYKELVRTWHPDRYTHDPAGRDEAESRLREINLAYRVLSGTPGASFAGSAAESARGPQAPASPAAPGARLTREQIDEMVRAIGTEGPIDALLASLGRFSALARVGCMGWLLFAVVVALMRSLLAPLTARQTGALVVVVLITAVAIVGWRGLRGEA